MIGYLAMDRTLNASEIPEPSRYQFYFVPAVSEFLLVVFAIVWSSLS